VDSLIRQGADCGPLADNGRIIQRPSFGLSCRPRDNYESEQDKHLHPSEHVDTF